MTTESHLTTLRYKDVELWFAGLAHGHCLNLAHCKHAVNNLAKDNVLVVEPVALAGCNEELEEEGGGGAEVGGEQSEEGKYADIAPDIANS